MQKVRRNGRRPYGRIRAGLLLFGLAALGACSDDGPGTVTATILGPNGDEGAAVVLLRGDGIATVRGSSGTEVFLGPGGVETRVVLIHPTGGTLQFDIDVADVGASLSAEVIEVAGPDDALRGDVSAYSVEFVR